MAKNDETYFGRKLCPNLEHSVSKVVIFRNMTKQAYPNPPPQHQQILPIPFPLELTLRVLSISVSYYMPLLYIVPKYIFERKASTSL